MKHFIAVLMLFPALAFAALLGPENVNTNANSNLNANTQGQAQGLAVLCSSKYAAVAPSCAAYKSVKE